MNRLITVLDQVNKENQALTDDLAFIMEQKMCEKQIIKMEPVEQKKQVPLQLDVLCNDLDELETAIAILRDKLSPVLGDELRSVSDTEEDQDLVPLAARIRGVDRRLRIMLSTVRYFSEACQL